MVIAAEPDPAPRRSLYVMTANDEWISKRFADDFDPASTARDPNIIATIAANTIRTVTVYQVFENANGTNFIAYTLDFKCQAGMVSIPQAISYDRAGKQEKAGSPDWMRVPGNWIGKAEMIACDWKSWQAAKQAWQAGDAPKPRRKKSAEPTASFASLGMEYLGEANIMRVTDVVDLVWNTRWTDAVQPAYYEGTAQEKAAAQAKLAALQTEISTVLNDQTRKVEEDIKRADRIDKKLGQISEKFFREMQGIDGDTEDDVIARWGIPQGLVETTPGVRQLNYYWSDTETVQVPYDVQIFGIGQFGNQVPMGQRTEYRPETRTVQCYRKLFLKEGGQLPGHRVFDFDVGCS